MIKKIYISVFFLLFSPFLYGVDANEGLNQLKLNVSNSKSNLEQYKKNLEIASSNIDEIDKAIKSLKEQKIELMNTSQNVEKNKKSLDTMKLKVQAYRKEEEVKLNKDDLRIKELQALLIELEKTRSKRQANINAYDSKIQEIDQEKLDWDKQRQSVVDLEKEIQAKELAANTEKQTWLGKKEVYKGEVAKWTKQPKDSEVTYKKYEKLK